MHPGRPITPVQKRSVAILFIFVVIQVERETVMTAWQLHWGLRGSSQYLEICLYPMLFHMLNLSVFVYFCDLFMAFFYYVLIFVLSFMVRIMNGVVQGVFIPSHTLTCIFMT